MNCSIYPISTDGSNVQKKKVIGRTQMSWCSYIGFSRTTEYQMGVIGNQKSPQNMIQMFILPVRQWKADFKTPVGFNLFVFISDIFLAYC